METLISLVGLSGLTFLAYKHSEAFKPIQKLLNLLGAVIVICITLWNMAVSYAYIELYPYISKEIGVFVSSEVVVEALKIPFGLTILAYLPLTFFLVLLSAIPFLIKKNKKIRKMKSLK